MLFVEGYSEGWFFRHLFNQLFRRQEFLKYISYDGHLFFENGQNLMYISEMTTKIEKGCFFFETIVPEFIAINCPY